MAVQRSLTTKSYADVLERVLDKGVVVDARLSISLAGIGLIGFDALVGVASIPAFVKFSRAEERDGATFPPPETRPQTERPIRTTRGPRGARHPLRSSPPLLRCPQGCTFEGAGAQPVTTPCPYRPRRVCVLQPC
jgi:hypothetical protein